MTEDEYESIMLFLNHSCEPNVGFGGNVMLVAMRDIAAGAELTTDYALFDDYDGSMECQCGRPACRGRIDGHDWQRPELQERYRGLLRLVHRADRVRTAVPARRRGRRLRTGGSGR
ncbi:MAG: SET domain-containing protein-lysine N-methyltransferase [Nocardioidaceae bacterium]